MSKTILALIAVAGIALAFKVCSVKETKNVPFAGTWVHQQKNNINGFSTDTTYQVTTDGKRFRIESDTKDNYYGSQTKKILVFNGTEAYSVSYDLKQPDDIETSAKPVTKAQVQPYLFWKEIISPNEKAGPGGQIAGRQTLLFQIRENRREGKLTSQVWLDEETGIMLKNAMSIYSSQVEMEISKETYECQSITFDSPAESAFEKPF